MRCYHMRFQVRESVYFQMRCGSDIVYVYVRCARFRWLYLAIYMLLRGRVVRRHASLHYLERYQCDFEDVLRD
jgi:hypothetical protein